VLKKLEIRKASIVGHSMGSLVSLEFAARHPEQCERVALIATGFPMKVAGPFLEAARNNDYAAFDMQTIWGHAPQIALGANPNPGMWMYGDSLARLERLAPGVLYNDLKACNEYGSGTESALKVNCPVLFILGRRDVMTPPRAVKLLQEKIPGARTVEVAPSGHSLMAEAPDATLDALIEFISSG
jgi:pimeloyl-ACP methyl ester carboxylesterase